MTYTHVPVSMLIGYCQIIIIVSKILKYIINYITYFIISYHNSKYIVLVRYDIFKVKRNVNINRQKTSQIKTLLPDVMIHA